MLSSRALSLARSAALRSPIITPRVLASRTLIAAQILPYQSIRRWNHQGGSGNKPPSSNIPPFPRPPKDGSSPAEPISESSNPPEASEVQSGSIPKKPLPDLRQGLPSTFEAEFLKDSKAKEESASGESAGEPDITDADPSSHGKGSGGRGDIPKSAYESSIDKRRNRMARFFYIFFTAAGLFGAFWAGRDWEDEEAERAHPDAPSGWGLMLWYNRIRARSRDQLGYYTEPTFPKLLPDKTAELEAQLPPYTLVLSLENLMVHEEWTREDGWRIAKRPGLDFFLMYLARHYELCLFTSVPSMSADPIIKKLDPYHFIMWPLFREATRYDNGDYIKDLAYLNRPLEKTILVDTKPSHAKAQPENAIIIPPWNGDPNDRELLALIPFLEYISMFGVQDVREVIKSFDGKYVPTEFARREALMREKIETVNKTRLGQKITTSSPATPSSSSGGLLGRIASGLGMKRESQPGPGSLVAPDGSTVNLLEEMSKGKTIFDIYREQNMEAYKAIQQQIKDEGAKWLADEAEALKKLEAEEIKKMKGSFFGMFTGGSEENK